MARQAGIQSVQPLRLQRRALPDSVHRERRPRMLIVCCGNADRGDDGAGPACADALRMLGVASKCLPGDAFSLLESWTGHPKVWIIDAVSTGAAPGTLHRFEIKDGAGMEEFETRLGTSTHGFGIAEAFRLGKITHCLPAEAVIYGIEAESFDWGAGLSASVHQAVQRLASQLAAETAVTSAAPAQRHLAAS